MPESNVIECFFIAFSPPLEGFLGPILFGFIRNPLNLCDIDLQRLIKKSGYHDEFVKFFSYEKRGENLKACVEACIVWKKFISMYRRIMEDLIHRKNSMRVN